MRRGGLRRGGLRRGGLRGSVAAMAAGCLVLVACTPVDDLRLGDDLAEAPHIAAFYELPDDVVVAGEPGTLVRSEEIAGAPFGARAWRVVYRSTDLDDRPVLSSGLVVAPTGPAPTGGRPVMAWGHPTTGSAPRCAPSRWLDPFLTVEGLRSLLDRGFVVTASDYTGAGVDGPDSYLVGVTEGHNLLDSVRAARALEGTGAGADLVLWGHSQGGQAALFAAQLADGYAPELRLHGIAAAAPAADLGSLLDAHLDDVSGVTIGAYAFQAYAEVYGPTMPGADLASVLTPEAIDALPAMNELCLLTQAGRLHDLARPLIGSFFVADPSTTEPWTTLLAENTPSDLPTDVPVFIAQGLADELVEPADTERFVAGLRAAGSHVEEVTYEHVDHGLVAVRAVPRMTEWLDGLRVPGAARH